MQVAKYSSLVLPPEPGELHKKAHVDSGTFTILASNDWTSGTWRVRGQAPAFRTALRSLGAAPLSRRRNGHPGDSVIFSHDKDYCP
jgi:hypothetical protein